MIQLIRSTLEEVISKLRYLDRASSSSLNIFNLGNSTETTSIHTYGYYTIYIQSHTCAWISTATFSDEHTTF